MLTPKKIEKNKLITYISVIAIMIAGTGFFLFLYKNYSLTTAKKSMTTEAPAEMNGQSIYNLDNLSKEIKLEEEEAVQEKKGADSAMEELKPEKELLDLSLLADAKFKKLRENVIKEGDFKVIKEGDFKVGKSNPFAPD